MKKLLWGCLLMTTLALTGCLDIIEEITLNKDGSGKYVMSVDLTQMISMMKTYMPDSVSDGLDENALLDSLSGMGATPEMDSMMNVLEAVEGINHVNTRMDGFEMIVSYDFDNVESLNRASSENSFTAQQGLKKANYSWKKGRFGRNFQQADLESEDEEMEESMAMAKMMMQEATFTTVYNFPGKVKKVSNEAAKLSNGKKTVTLKSTFGDLFEDPAAISNEIRFKSK